MADLEKPTPPPTVSCKICRKELPRSIARTEEGRDYVYYFCGADCYQKWIAERPRADNRPR